MKNTIILALIVLSYRPLINAQSISAVTNSTGESISAISNNTMAGSGVYGQGFNGSQVSRRVVREMRFMALQLQPMVPECWVLVRGLVWWLKAVRVF